MEVKDDLIPELELSIIPSEGNTLRVELMHEDFIEYLKKTRFINQSILKDDIAFITLRELKLFIERLQKAYKEYCEE